MKLLLLSTPLYLQALSLFSLTAEPTGLSIPKGSVVILSEKAIELAANPKLHSHTSEIVVCHDKQCIQNVIDEYKQMYRTNGIRLIKW